MAKPKAPKKVKETFVCLDLGCGENKQTVESLFQQSLIPAEKRDIATVIGVDQYSPSADVKHDLTQFPYPFEDNSIDAVFTSHFLEHLNGKQRIKFFNELYRICKKGARLRHIHPYYKSSRAVQDPTHEWPAICEDSYLYWNKEWREMNKLGHYLGDCNFVVESMHYTWQDPKWATKVEEQRNFAIAHYFNVVADLIVTQVKI